jgi:hypothetical protein
MIAKNRSERTKRDLVKMGLNLPIILLLIAMTLGMPPIQDAQADSIKPLEAVSPEGLLNPDGTLDLSTGFQGSLDLHGWEVTLDSQLGPVLKPEAQLAGTWEPGWRALPNQGLNSNVFCAGNRWQ